MLPALALAVRAYRHWRGLPTEERQRLAGEVQRLIGLTRELGGDKAVKALGAPVEADAAAPMATRPRAVVMRELAAAATSLLASGGTQLVSSTARRSRVARITRAVARKALGGRRGRGDADQETPKPDSRNVI